MYGYIVQNLCSITSPFGQMLLPPPLKLCIQLPSGVVDPLSLYQTQHFNRLSNLLMALLMFIYFYTSLITIAHVWQLLYLIYIGQSFSHKHDISYVYMYHVCSQEGLVEYFHCNNSIFFLSCHYTFPIHCLTHSFAGS